MLYTFAVATILITLAELGDKTQLLALALATKYKAWQVIVGIFVATVVIHFFSTLIGGLIGSLIPEFWMRLVAGVLFVGFGVWTLRGDDDQDADEATAGSRYGPIVTTAVAFFLAEIGDKTQIMTMTIAADPAAVLKTLGAAGPMIGDFLAGIGLTARSFTPAESFWGVWMGSTVGMMIADGAAIVVGRVLGRTMPEKLISRIAGVVFILFGVVYVVTAFLIR